VYREEIKSNFNLNSLNIRIEDISSFDHNLATAFMENPSKILPIVRNSKFNFLKFEEGAKDAAETLSLTLKQVQLSFSWNAKPMGIRDLSSDHVSKLIAINGIVIKASRTQSKATVRNPQNSQNKEIFLKCTKCGDEKIVSVAPGFSGIQIPQKCSSEQIGAEGDKSKKICPNDPYTIISDKCKFIDQQTLKLQELPENVPTGEMPRSVVLIVGISFFFHYQMVI
jgi:DNA replication licensing factor MCM5